MENSESIPVLNFHFNEDEFEKDAKEIINFLRPGWNESDISFTLPTVGFMNLTVICRNSQSPDDVIVIQTLREVFCGSVDDSHKLHRFIHRHKLGPKIFMLFNNGVAMEFVKGENFHWESPKMYDDSIWKRIAEEMAKWHRSEILTSALEFGIREMDPTKLNLEKYWDTILDMPFLKDHKVEYPSKDELMHQYKILIDDMVEKNELTPAFLHFDVNPANTFISDDAPGVKFIDFDCSGIYFVEYELAWFFRSFKEYSGPTDFVPGRDYELQFIRYYLEQRHMLDNDGAVTEDHVLKTYMTVQKAKLLVTLRSIIFPTFIQAFSKVMYFYIPHVKQLWRDFREEKNRIYEEFSG